jgi:RsmE family RNA methyltransferase
VNLLLLEPGELDEGGVARIGGRRAAHVRDVLRAAPGDRLAAGVVGGRMGTAEVLAAGDELRLAVALDRDPPPRAPIDLLLALPRPKILRKVLQAAAGMGLRRLVLLGSYRVEKSYWGSPLLAPGALAEQLRLGLEQARDTVPPEVLVHPLFKPFVEDTLDGTFAGAARLVADLAAPLPLSASSPAAPRAVVAIGPEGGWTRYEADALAARGFAPFTLGERALRVDVAVPYAVGQVALWLGGAVAGGGRGP